MQEMAARFKTAKASNVATINPVAVALWTIPVTTVINGKDEALREARKKLARTIDVYTDALVRNDRVGIGVFSDMGIELSETVARIDTMTTLMAELSAIMRAARLVSDSSSNPERQIRIIRQQSAL